MKTEQQNFIAELHRNHSAPMIQLAYRLIGDRFIAEDLVQEAFLTACFKSDELATHVNPVGWLYKTLSFLILRERNRAYHRLESPMVNDDFPGAEDSLPLELVIPTELSENEKELIINRYEKRFTYEELAEKKGITQEACRKQLSRALQHCRSLM